MSSHVRARLACAALILLSTVRAHAESVQIDLQTAIARARERAPDAVAALGQIAQARAQRAGAGVLFTQNPEIQVGAGARFGQPRTLTAQVQVAQQLEPWRRSARIGVAEAQLAHARALSEAELRELSFEVASVFFEARFADLAVELARRNQEVAARAFEAAERRRRAGDITDLDVNLAKIALGRARSALAASRSERAQAVGALGAVIGADPEDALTLTGGLAPTALALDALRSAVQARADVRALEAEARLAKAEGDLARANGRPTLGVWFGYEREEGDTILAGGLSFTLPLWNRAQGAKAAARARLRQAELQKATVVSAASRQIVDAFDAYARAREGVEIFERDVLPTLVDSEQLLERSVETGQITVNQYLVARQEILSGRREHLERQLGVAKAATAARFVAGMNP